VNRNYNFYVYIWDSSVSITTGWMAHNSGFDSWQGQEIFLFTAPCPGELLLGIKQHGQEADHPPPSITEVKNSGAIIFTPPYILMLWCLIA
jgi:hypothetical protein